MIKFITLIFALLFSSMAYSSAILPGGLKGGDLTDPEDDASPNSLVGYNATFSASHENFFTGEGAFNVFDNTVGSGSAKWCCDGTPVWIEANFGSDLYNLTSFTITSGNDADRRDPDIWSIQGSTDGTSYTDIFNYSNDGTSPFTARLQTVEFVFGTDFSDTNAYSIFRYTASSQVSGSQHQINELEFFGNEVPEPSIIALFGLGLVGLGFARRRQA